jgi:hypothetical protein
VTIVVTVEIDVSMETIRSKARSLRTSAAGQLVLSEALDELSSGLDPLAHAGEEPSRTGYSEEGKSLSWSKLETNAR